MVAETANSMVRELIGHSALVIAQRCKGCFQECCGCEATSHFRPANALGGRGGEGRWEVEARLLEAAVARGRQRARPGAPKARSARGRAAEPPMMTTPIESRATTTT
jgi:hypothetical protein